MNIDDRIVDHDSQGNCQASQDHRVERRTPHVEHEERRKQRHHDSSQTNQSSAPAIQEESQDKDEEQRGNDKRPAEVREGHLNKAGRAEKRGIEFDARHTGLHGSQFCLNPACHLQRVDSGQLFDDQHQVGAFVDNCIADQQRVIFYHLRHILQAQAFTVYHGHLRQFIR